MEILDTLLHDGTCPFPEEGRSSSTIDFLLAQSKESFEGDPWFGRNARSLLGEIDAETALQKPGGQHSILELLWHMINWKAFALGRMLPSEDQGIRYYETNDWSVVEHTEAHWQTAKERFFSLQEAFIKAIESRDDAFLAGAVEGRNYSFRKLLNGVIQHDIYHLGQIAYIKKVIKGTN